jgi:Xaa-Pro aminopeptidase
MDVAGRARRLAREVADRCDAVMISKPANLRWLTGFTGSNGVGALVGDELIVVTDGRYRIQIEHQLSGAGVTAQVLIGRELDDLLLSELEKRLGPSLRLGVESHHITWDRQRSLVEQLEQRRGSGAELEALGPVIDDLRQIKDDGEVDRLRRAAEIADGALAEVVTELSELGPESFSERRLARRLESAMLERGADDASFPTIVASGPNSALPHARPGDRIIDRGDLVIIDMGARVDGYGSDMTRTFAIGGFNSETEDLYRAVESAQAAGLAAVKHDVEAVAVDEACRRVLAEHDLVEAFVHGTGHGIGLEIHENPFLSRTSTAMIRSGQAITIEPGVYIPGLGGVRIEDSIIVTDSGHIPLTLSPKDPVVAA